MYVVRSWKIVLCVFGRCSNCSNIFVVVVCPFFLSFFSFQQSLDEIKMLRYINAMAHTKGQQQHALALHDYFYCREHLFIVFECLGKWTKKKKVLAVAIWLQWTDTHFVFFCSTLFDCFKTVLHIHRNQFVRTSLPTSSEQQCVQHQIHSTHHPAIDSRIGVFTFHWVDALRFKTWKHFVVAFFGRPSAWWYLEECEAWPTTFQNHRYDPEQPTATHHNPEQPTTSLPRIIFVSLHWHHFVYAVLFRLWIDLFFNRPFRNLFAISNVPRTGNLFGG